MKTFDLLLQYWQGMWRHVLVSTASWYLSAINRMWIFHYLFLSAWTLLSRKVQDPEYFNMNKSIMSTNSTLYLECFKDCLYLTEFMIVVFPYFSLLILRLLFWTLLSSSELWTHVPETQCNTAAPHLQSRFPDSSVTSDQKSFSSLSFQ